ncbi:MAG: type II toxin-antitoxin system PemK/MazF family toxin [Actinomycetota bacterium]
MVRGEIWWGESPDQKGRPYVILTRSAAIPVLRTLLVAPVTRTVRGIPTEISLGRDHGLEFESAATMDNLLTFPKSMLTRRIGELSELDLVRMCDAIRAATGC